METSGFADGRRYPERRRVRVQSHTAVGPSSAPCSRAQSEGLQVPGQHSFRVVWALGAKAETRPDQYS
jgi:hypothetical protein